MLNAKQVFNRIKDHLLSQNKKALPPDKNAICQYRYGDLKCAVGCLIRDDLYTKEIEGANVDGIPGTSFAARKQEKLYDILLQSGVPVHNMVVFHILERTQRIHDNIIVLDWERNLNALREELGL